MNPDQNDKQQSPGTPHTIYAPPHPEGPVLEATVTSPQQSYNTTRQKQSKLLPIIVGVVIALAVLVALASFLIANSSSQSTKQSAKSTSSNTNQDASTLQPATAIELEQANNSISQDLSGIDDEKDFPTTSLDDKSIGL
jgi:hypothetical protein